MQREVDLIDLNQIPESQIYPQSPSDIAEVIERAGLATKLISCLDSILDTHENQLLKQIKDQKERDFDHDFSKSLLIEEMETTGFNFELALDHLVSEIWEDSVEKKLDFEGESIESSVPMVRVLKPTVEDNLMSGKQVKFSKSAKSDFRNESSLPGIKLILSRSENKSIRNLESEEKSEKYGDNLGVQKHGKKKNGELQTGVSSTQRSQSRKSQVYENQKQVQLNICKKKNKEEKLNHHKLKSKKNKKNPNQNMKNSKHMIFFRKSTSTRKIPEPFLNRNKRRKKVNKKQKSEFKFNKKPKKINILKEKSVRKKKKPNKESKTSEIDRLNSMKSIYKMLQNRSVRKMMVAEKRDFKYSFEDSEYCDKVFEKMSTREIEKKEEELRKREEEIKKREIMLELREKQHEQRKVALDNMERIRKHTKTLKSSSSKFSGMRKSLVSSEEISKFLRSGESNGSIIRKSGYKFGSKEDVESFPIKGRSQGSLGPGVIQRLSKEMKDLRGDISIDSESKTHLNNLIKERVERDMKQVLKSNVPNMVKFENLKNDSKVLKGPLWKEAKKKKGKRKSPDVKLERTYREDLEPNEMLGLSPSGLSGFSGEYPIHYVNLLFN